MLKDFDSSAIVAVSDLARAKQFYGETLGLELADQAEEQGVMTYETGNTRLVVYESPDAAGTNQANAVVWGVGDEIDKIFSALQRKGVRFLHYPDLEGVTLEGDMHRSGEMKLLWLADPDDNILHIHNM
jgi:catechol 2,3-dioxygenase-like lactoylglutathione lyase family enzyme